MDFLQEIQYVWTEKLGKNIVYTIIIVTIVLFYKTF